MPFSKWGMNLSYILHLADCLVIFPVSWRLEILVLSTFLVHYVCHHGNPIQEWHEFNRMHFHHDHFNQLMTPHTVEMPGFVYCSSCEWLSSNHIWIPFTIEGKHCVCFSEHISPFCNDSASQLLHCLSCVSWRWPYFSSWLSLVFWVGPIVRWHLTSWAEMHDQCMPFSLLAHNSTKWKRLWDGWWMIFAQNWFI
jgi:hypothetical protein